MLTILHLEGLIGRLESFQADATLRLLEFVLPLCHIGILKWNSLILTNSFAFAVNLLLIQLNVVSQVSLQHDV